MLLEHLGGHPVDVVEVGEVAGVGVGHAAELLDLARQLVELGLGPRHQEHRSAGLARS